MAKGLNACHRGLIPPIDDSYRFRNYNELKKGKQLRKPINFKAKSTHQDNSLLPKQSTCLRAMSKSFYYREFLLKIYLSPFPMKRPYPNLNAKSKAKLRFLKNGLKIPNLRSPTLTPIKPDGKRSKKSMIYENSLEY